MGGSEEHPSCPHLHIAVNSAAAYTAPRARLLADLKAAGVPSGQVHVFLAGSSGDPHEREGVHHYPAPHESVDFTAMVELAERSEQFVGAVRRWFYLHDTTTVGAQFWRRAVSAGCDALPACALPLTRYLPASSMGLYEASFIATHRNTIVAQLKNSRGAPVARWKKRGFGWEDKVFKMCDAESVPAVRRFTRQCWNKTLGRNTCLCSTVEIDQVPQVVYGPDSAPRQAWRFDCMAVVKWKANWARNLTMVLKP